MTDPRLMLDLYGEDPAQPVDLYGASDQVPELPWLKQQTMQAPSTQNLSVRIQELLGAKEPDQGGTIMDILSSRFNSNRGTSIGDYAQGIKNSALGTPTLGGEVTQNRIANTIKQINSLQDGNNQEPSSVREYKYYKQLPGDAQAEFLRIKRAAQLMNLGGSIGVLDPMSGGMSTQFEKTAPPQDMPGFKKQQAIATKLGENLGERGALLNQMQASLPQLETTINQLSDLGKKATYTYAGQAVNQAKRQVGLPPGEGAVARQEYINTVRDVLFPQLRATFGAQFTAKEGEALVGTLGDLNLSPEEKDAALRAFIDQKKQSILSMQREIGVSNPAPVVTGQIKFLGFE